MFIKALKCFQKAIHLDGFCAMAHWGVSFSTCDLIVQAVKLWQLKQLSSSQIAYLDQLREQARVAGERADDLLENKHGQPNSVERELIHVTLARNTYSGYSQFTNACEQWADAIGELSERNPNDAELAFFYAQALLSLYQFQQHENPDIASRTYTNLNNTSNITNIPKIHNLNLPASDSRGNLHLNFQNYIQQILPRFPKHVGLLSLYSLSLATRSEDEIRANLSKLRSLTTLCPQLSYPLHLPLRLRARIGQYTQVIGEVEKAIRADRVYANHSGRDYEHTGAYLTALQRAEKYHILTLCAMQSGQSAVALKGATDLAQEITLPAPSSDSDDSPIPHPLAVFIEPLLGLKIHVLLRFGRWKEILQESVPAVDGSRPFTRAVVLYGRVVALASLERVAEAKAEYEVLLPALQQIPASTSLFGLSVTAVTKIMDRVASAHVSFRQGHAEESFVSFRQAMVLEDSLRVDNNLHRRLIWPESVRHTLGALLLHCKQTNEACHLYINDLLTSPDNIWALYGLYQCYNFSDPQGNLPI